MNPCIMAVGAHADDIEIGVGGMIAKYLERGYELVYVMSTNNMSGNLQEEQADGSYVGHRLPPVPTMARRKAECDVAAKALGTVPIHLDHPQRHYNTGEGDAVVSIGYEAPHPPGIPTDRPSILMAHEDAASRQRVVDLILKHEPELIVTHGVSQRDIEHIGTSFLVTRSYWEAVERGYRGGLLHWREDHNYLGRANAHWDTFVDISGYAERKMELIGMHKCQMPHWRSPTFSFRLRVSRWGAACGCEAAEVLTWVKQPEFRDPYGSVFGPVFGQLSTELLHHTR